MPSTRPETRYAKSGDVNIAYQVVGDGPLDLVYVPGWISNVESIWEEPAHAHVLDRLASFSRLILFDKRGTGLSDPVPLDRLPDARGAHGRRAGRPGRRGLSTRGAVRLLRGRPAERLLRRHVPRANYRARHSYGAFAKRLWSPDYPWAPKPDDREREIEVLEQNWSSRMDLDQLAPSEDDAFKDRLATYFRRSASPGAGGGADAHEHAARRARRPAVDPGADPDLHRTHDRDVKVEEGRWIATQIPGATFVELPGDAHTLWAGDTDEIVDEVEEFLTGARRGPEPDRVLATVLFTDIVGSTERATELGDRRWRELLERHHALVRQQLERYRGREVDTAGDGFLATLRRPGPRDPVRLRESSTASVRSASRSAPGVHTGECELFGDKVAGLAVNTGARVASLAGAG